MQLTEDMILNRSKQSKLQAVKELNLCGYSLSDVSVISRLPNVEVLALSVNNIRSLAPFANCVNLKELYLRRNNIDNVNQLFYLQGLPRLKNLWLIENPFCTQLDYNYRAAVLSILPHVKVLDNVAVSREEIERSKNIGVTFDPMISLAAQTQTQQIIPLPAAPAKPNIVEDSNVLSAIYTLVKDLDLNGLEALHHSVERRISQIYSEQK